MFFYFVISLQVPARPGLASPRSGKARAHSPSPLSHRINIAGPFLLFQLSSMISFSLPIRLAPPLSASLAHSLAQLPAPPYRPGAFARTSTHTCTTPKAATLALLAIAATPCSRFCSLSCSKIPLASGGARSAFRIVALRRSRFCSLSNALTFPVPRPLLGVSPFLTGNLFQLQFNSIAA